ncbi:MULTISPECIES: DUF4267 domain-containing protein [unclassified Streptomyces]|uniref:DUF4267 domain-containing protein n=1 Tax=unclassified Streptomyces TaxID=2593676 RepID=UPI00225A94F8|nr:MULTISPECIES: DUF4267 domain-containing protein [unclassified Streptomyces]MCX4528552.1 DUF4267 domain-containing protein [Streptomyces sp. NBC_01551]MCX4540850.1 DUF4267 domain-containing protein [Streptomyces sp. NBC_01565]
MTVKHLATALAALGVAFILYIGFSYLIAPQASASQFGVPTWPRQDGTAFLAVKGVRDIVSGLIVLVLLVTGHRRALGWTMAALAFVPLGDMVIVLSAGGPAATAYGIHGATAAAVALTAALLLRERPSAAARGGSGITPSAV